MTAKRLTAVVLLLAVVLGGAVLLRPTETTLAAWSDEVVVAMPALSTGGVRVDVTPSGSASATFGVSGDLSGSWQPSAVRVTADGRDLSGAELAGSRIEYRVTSSGGSCSGGNPAFTATPSGSGTSFAVTGGQQLSGARTLCLTFVPSDKVRVQLGGHTLSFATTVDGVAAGASSWTAATTWSANQQLPAAPTLTGPTCSRGVLNQSVTLGWSWDRAALSQNASHFSLQLEDRGTWREVSTLPVNAQSVRISPYQFDFINFDTYTMRVAAVLTDGTTIPSSTSSKIRVERVGLGAAYCA